LSKNPEIQFKFCIFNGNKALGDEQIAKETISLLPQQNVSVVPYTNNVKSVWDEMKKCELIFSTRLHASVFACDADIPFVLIEYYRKCADFVKDVGYSDDLRIYDAEFPSEQVVGNILSILDRNYNSPSNIQETIKRARLNFTEIKL